MKFIFIILLITFSIVILTAFFLRSRKRGKRTLYVGGKPTIKKKKKAKPPISKEKIMGPENPLWVKMYAEEMAKRNTALTANVLKKWIADDPKINFRPDFSR